MQLSVNVSDAGIRQARKFSAINDQLAYARHKQQNSLEHPAFMMQSSQVMTATDQQSMENNQHNYLRLGSKESGAFVMIEDVG